VLVNSVNYCERADIAGSDRSNLRFTIAAPPPAPARIERPLGHATARGFAWSISQALTVKIVNFGGQIVLSWVLLTRDYGYVGLALTIATFTALIQQAGIRDVLVQRGRHYDLWAGPAFMLSLFTGLLGAALLVASAPFVSRFYHEPRLNGLILVLALGGFVNCLTLVPYAKLQVELRFRFMALLALVTACFSMGLSIILAVLGAGAYSFVIPIPLTGVVWLAILWPVVRPPVRTFARVRRMRYLFGDNLTLLGATFFLSITSQGDYIILGRMYSKDLVGLYFWAFNLSLQSLVLFAETLTSVLFPSLSRLQGEPERQAQAFVRAVRAIALLGIPACFAQAALAEPVVHLLFRAQWYPAIPLLQILSVGMAFQVVERTAYAALKAQGRFRLMVMLTAIYAIVFVVLVWIGSARHAALGAAVAVSIYSLLASFCSALLATGGGFKALWELPSIFAAPVGIGAVSGGCAFLATRVLPKGTRMEWLLNLLLSAMVMLVVLLPLARWLARQTWDDLILRLGGLIGLRSQARNSVEPVGAPCGAPADNDCI
jgi:PST family polysaccharide transporter